MARSALASVGSFALLLSLSSPVLADSACGGVVISDVIETASGERTTVGERCYERAPGAPYYYDAPTGRGGIEVEVTPVTSFDASAIQAMGAMDLMDVANPFPAGQGRADSRPE
jgi:hypothetical protein